MQHDCPKPIEIRVMGRRYPHRQLCGCGEGRNPSPGALQREVENWLATEYANGVEKYS